MYLMRIGSPGAEKPVARIDDDTYVDLSGVVTDFDEAFFGSGGIDRVRPLVAERAGKPDVALRRRARRRPDRAPAPDPVHRAQLP